MSVVATPEVKRPQGQISHLFAEQGGKIVVPWTPPIPMGDDRLLQFCRDNEGLRVEQNAEGDLIIMPPVGLEGSHRCVNLYGPFGTWQMMDGGGECFDSSVGFRLPSGALPSPDVSWVRQEQMDKLTAEQWRKYPPALSRLRVGTSLSE